LDLKPIIAPKESRPSICPKKRNQSLKAPIRAIYGIRRFLMAIFMLFSAIPAFAMDCSAGCLATIDP
jgi:hypothetical protein